MWEKDILENPELCSLLIKLYIVNNGMLDNYHSFNYVLQKDKLTLKSQLIQPYQDMESKKIKKYIKIAV